MAEGNPPDATAPPASAPPSAQLVEAVRVVARTRDDTTEIETLNVQTRRLQNTDLAQTIELKKMYARRLLWGLGAQIAFVDLVFLGYAYWGVHWKINVQVMDAWLGATVIEVIGIVLVVTKHLFPPRDA